MANPRTKFDMLAEYLSRTHEGVSMAEIYRRPGLKHRSEPFCLFFNDGMAFRLHGRSLVAALALAGVLPFDPLNPDQPPPGRPGWVWAPPEPPPSPPESLAERVKKFLGSNSWSKWLG